MNDCIYKNLARILSGRIGTVEFFNGTVSIEEDGFSISLRSTLLVYHADNAAEGSADIPFRDIVPVWYECEVSENGAVVANEFSWKEFKNFLPLERNCI